MPLQFDNPLGSNQLPTHVQAEQQVVADEVNITLPGGAVGSFTALFDKDTTTTVAFTGILIVDITHPMIINRICVRGALNAVTITVRDQTNALTVIAVAVTNANGYDSGTIDSPILANQITFTSAGASTFSELTINKTIPVMTTTLVEQSDYVEFVAQKVYWDPLNTNTGGAPSLQYHLLTRIPLETNAEDAPAINVDSEVATITNDAVDGLRLQVYFHEFSQSTHEIRNMARAMVTVEMGANARCTTLRSRLCLKDITNNATTFLTPQKNVTLNVDGPAIRHVRFVHQDVAQQNLTSNQVLYWDISVWGRQTAANVIPSYLTLWFRRGTFDCKLETEVVSESEG